MKRERIYSNNISIFDTPYSSVPFSQVRNMNFKSVIEELITDSLKEIEEVANNYKTATFENTIIPLAYSSLRIDRYASVLFNLNSADTTDDLQQQAQEVSPLLADYANDIRLNGLLFKRIKSIYKRREQLGLTAEQLTLVEKTYRSFVRNGALLRDRKARLREIDRKLALLKLKFSENVLAENQLFIVHISDFSKINGLPEYALAMANEEAKKRNLEGWVFTLDFPLYTAVMKNADNRELRRKLFVAYNSRCAHNNLYNNHSIVLEIVSLRRERARLLGYENYAAFVLEERMAETPENVQQFLTKLLDNTITKAKEELNELREFAETYDAKHKLDQYDGKFQQWDFAYYAEKLKQERFKIDDNLLKPYLLLDKAVEGMFAVANKLYGLQFSLTEEVEVYHPEVKAYKVSDAGGAYIGLLYTDFFPRIGKRNGAWMTTFKEQYVDLLGNDSRPHISIVCNFTRPTAAEPSLLTFNELTTLFHEFGHALHGLLSQVTYPSLSGTNVARDFVELPSQLMENWCYEEETLRLFATHYQTGELLPIEWVQKIKEAEKFMENILTVRQLNFGFLDMMWHSFKYNTKIGNIKLIEENMSLNKELYQSYDKDLCISTSFSHIFSGGYAAGYYSYKWSEVLADEAFKVFKEWGVFDKNVALRFRNEVLSKGSSEKEKTLYERFQLVNALINK